MSAAMEPSQKYVLGIDLGSASLGWAIVALDEDGNRTSLLDAGVRIFEPGVDGTTLDIQQGKDQSKAVDRRTARLHRRQLRRRAARQRELFVELQSAGLMSAAAEGFNGANSTVRNKILTEFDQQLGKKFAAVDMPGDFGQLPLYLLRKRALDHALEPFELGRVFFHLIQRRGFKSNRKDTRKSVKDREDQGQVKAEIHSLELAMEAAKARTLGEYFAGLNPHDSAQKVRRRWTARRMFEMEFAAIWSKQSDFHPALLTTALHERLVYLLFFQRPVSAQKHLIGLCELERGDATHPPKRRAPWASLPAQRFRILQKINDLRLIDPRTDAAIPLNEQERGTLFQLLDTQGSQTFSAIRKHLGVPKGVIFNLERGGDKSMYGNRTYVSMLKVYGDKWADFTEGKQNQLIENWRNSESDDQLRQDAIAQEKLSPQAADQLVAEKAPADYCALSLTAIAKITPLLQRGKTFKEAEKEVYPDRFAGIAKKDRIPGVHEVLPTLRNPAVERALTELRKLVNALIRKYDKPHEIRIELARELKKPRGERQDDTDRTRKRERERTDVARRLLTECGMANPSRRDIEKALLYSECGGIDPYTGRSISFCGLFHDTEFDVEHIIPRSRFPLNSFQNKTLCHQSLNQLKGNRTPYEMFRSDPEEYERILNRIRAWPIKNYNKLRNFRVGEPNETGANTLESFTERQMNDTRYSSVAAARLLATLYGGPYRQRADGTNELVIYATSGSITAELRQAWGLEAILREMVPPQPGDSRGKPRSDHRHHAIDAITIACTRQKVIQAMATDSARKIDPRTRPKMEEPWKNFTVSIRPHIEQLLISHRPEHKLTGELHDETNYGKPYTHDKKTYVHIRKRLAALTIKDLPNIVDAATRHAVMAKADAVGGDLTICELKNDWPILATKDGRTIPIKKVRMRKVLDVTSIGNDVTRRYVAESSNHHIAIYAKLDAHGKEKRWDGIVVSLLDAYKRSAAGKRSDAYRQEHRQTPLIERTLPGVEDHLFKFSLMGGDTIEVHDRCDHGKGLCTPEIYRIRTIAASGQISMVKINDARMKKDVLAAGDWWSPRADALRKLSCRKVVVDLLGRVHPAND